MKTKVKNLGPPIGYPQTISCKSAGEKQGIAVVAFQWCFILKKNWAIQNIQVIRHRLPAIITAATMLSPVWWNSLKNQNFTKYQVTLGVFRAVRAAPILAVPGLWRHHGLKKIPLSLRKMLNAWNRHSYGYLNNFRVIPWYEGYLAWSTCLNMTVQMGMLLR